MIGRLIAAELRGLRRSMMPLLALLLVVGGSIVARVLAWIARAIGRTELGALPFMRPNMGWADAAIPLALLAYLTVTAYLFGRDFEDGSIDLLLTAAVRRDSIVAARTLVICSGVLVLSVMGWAADMATRAILATTPLDPGPTTVATAALGSAIAAIATLPVVAWAAVRFRGVLPALGAGIAVEVAVLAFGGLTLVHALPWYLPSILAAGGSASLLGVALSASLFVGGIAATVRELRAVDLYE